MVKAIIGNEIHFDAPDRVFASRLFYHFYKATCVTINSNSFDNFATRNFEFSYPYSLVLQSIRFFLFERTARAVRTARIFLNAQQNPFEQREFFSNTWQELFERQENFSNARQQPCERHPNPFERLTNAYQTAIRWSPVERENHMLFVLYLGGQLWVHLMVTLEANLTK